jgi:hypothetical protein
MYDSDLTTTTSPLTPSAPYGGQRPVTSINLRTEFLLQFQKQWEDSAILLASNRPQQEGQEKNRSTERERKLKERRTGKDYEHVGLQEAPHLQDPKQNHFENVKSRNFKQEVFFNKQPSSSL